jgi:hypothetical protein
MAHLDSDTEESQLFLAELKIRNSPNKTLKRIFTAAGWVCLVVLVTIAVGLAAQPFIGTWRGADRSVNNESKSVPNVNHAIQDCGSNPVEARKRGCIFDTMSFTWVRPECDDRELSVDFRRRYGYRYYEDDAGRTEVPYQIVQLGERDLYSSWEQHLVHCLYTWRKLHRSHEIGRPVDSYIANINHTWHCGEQWIEQLNNPSAPQTLNTLIYVKYTKCS